MQADPANEKAHVALALTEVANGRSDTGFEQLEALAGSEKGDLADLALISAKSEIGDLDGALKAADHLVAKEPQSARSYVVRGRILLARKDMTGARAAFEKATQIDPTDFAAVDLLANLDRSEGKADDAAKLYEAVLARQPGQPGASVALAQLRAAAGAAPAKVEALLTQSIREYPYAPDSRLALVRYRLTLHHAAEALAAAQDGVAAIPDNLDLQTVLGQSQLASGNNQQALSTFQKIAATSASTPEPLLNLADIYFGMSDYATTEQYLRKALAMSPHLILAERGLIKVALARKRPAEALQIATQIQQERPREAVGFLTEGEIQFQLRAWDPAIRAFRAALERDHSSQTAVRLEALYFSAGRPADAQRFAAEWLNQNPRDGDFLFLLASEATSRQDYASAEAKLRQVLALRPDNVATLNDLALVLSKQGKPEALTMAERATQLAAGNPVVMDTMATVLAADKQFAKALEWQRKAVAKAPGTPAYQFNLAKLLLATGDKAGARTELEQLAKLGGRYAGQAEVAAMMKSL
ncbi:MAG: PEP-CTERM system TPR-repeat protein PrsT [Burkholderiales bacterium]|nr:PEP-CTERM system TPR-repeat protein PrsT [Burkholderiales bacterium]